MTKRALCWLLTVLCTLLFRIGLASTTLPLPPNLIALNSPQGIQLFKQSQHRAFWALMPYFVTERGLAFCSIASSVMALNALQIPPPLTPEHAPYRIFNQSNFFNHAALLKIMTPASINHHGATLGQIAQALRLYTPKITAYHTGNVSLTDFKKAATHAVNAHQTFIIVNFCRKDLGEQGCGHFSPLAAYNKPTDRFLLLDVARYKYPPVWIKSADLYHAMQGIDGGSKQSRGYLIIQRPGDTLKKPAARQNTHAWPGSVKH
jgi:hypothetical protein